MKPIQPSEPRKRPVNLTLNTELVAEAKTLTGNLSGVVEMLLADFVSQEQARRRAALHQKQQTAALWNAFHTAHGSFADEHSTL